MHGPNIALGPQIFLPCLPFRTHDLSSPGTQNAYAWRAKPNSATPNISANLPMHILLGSIDPPHAHNDHHSSSIAQALLCDAQRLAVEVAYAPGE
jgi:hypothetical protein